MPLITITHSIGSGGRAIGETVAENLTLALYDDRKIQNLTAAHGMSPSDLETLDGKSPGFLDRLFGNKPQLYQDVMESVIYDIAKKGQGVIIGHGSQFLLQDFGCAFHVRIHSKRATRIERLMAQQGLHSQTAEKLVRKADEQQRGFLRYAFNFDVDNPDAYDLVINTGKLGPSAASKIIVDSIQTEELQECSLRAYEAMEKLALEKKIHSKMIEKHVDPSTLIISVMEGGEVRITGMASSEADKEKLPLILKDIPTVRKYDVDVAIWMPYV